MTVELTFEFLAGLLICLGLFYEISIRVLKRKITQIVFRQEAPLLIHTGRLQILKLLDELKIIAIYESDNEKNEFLKGTGKHVSIDEFNLYVSALHEEALKNAKKVTKN